jgi:CHAD domain-containing protein
MNAKPERPARTVGGNTRTYSQPSGAGTARPEKKAAKPAIVALPRIKPRQPAAELIRTALAGALARVEAADPEARRGDVEGVHRLRTSTRRLRSELHTVRDLVERDWRQHLQEELKWLADMLGSVRDLDILSHRLRSATATPTGEDQAPALPQATCQDDPLEPLFRELRERHARNSRALRDALQGERYRNLIGALEVSIKHPALTDLAWEPCREVLPPLAQSAWRRLRTDGRALEPDAPDADFHELRKRAKRARYTAELIAPALGRRALQQAQRFIRLTTQTQDVLGEHQDAIVAVTEIERLLADHPQDDDFVPAARRLVESQHRAAQAARETFFDVWKKLDRKKSLRWFRGREKVKV